jgi:hypothetical protein
MMKTVIIWDTVGLDPIRFVVADGDLSELDGVYINLAEDKAGEALQEKLSQFMYDSEGREKQPLLDAFPVSEVISGANVIICGFLP